MSRQPNRRKCASYSRWPISMNCKSYPFFLACCCRAEKQPSARAAPSEIFIGYLNLTIIEMNIYTLYRKAMLFCAECCGVPIFANTITAKCKQCHNDVPLRINPRLVGLLIDETGGVTSGKLIWSDETWRQLLGCTAENLAGFHAVQLKCLEQRLLFLRVVVLFGWSAEVGKLAVLRLTTT